MSKLSFVVLGDDWGRNVSTLQHVFARVAAECPVLWVNSFGHRIPRLTAYDITRAGRKLWRMVAGAPAPPPPLRTGGVRPGAIVEPRALPWHQFAVVRRFNRWSIERAIRRARTALPDWGDTVLVTGTPLGADLVGRLGEVASVYFCMDDYGELPGVSGTLLAPHEVTALERVDAVVATAEALVERKRPRSGRAYYLPQGVNYDHFSTARPCPPELVPLPRPIIGFAGGISDCVDFPLVRALAQSAPHASIVLVGPVTAERGVEGLAGLGNVHVLGNRPYDQLPAYVQHFDVGIIPYILNAWTLSVDPLKLLEYLAAGIPVVTTPLPEVRKYRDAVAIAEDVRGFDAAVRAAVTDRDPDARVRGRALAARNTWEARARALTAIVREIVQARLGPAGRAPALEGHRPDHPAHRGSDRGPDQPPFAVPLTTRIRRYGGLRRTWRRLERLLADHRFTGIAAGTGSACAGVPPGTPVVESAR